MTCYPIFTKQLNVTVADGDENFTD